MSRVEKVTVNMWTFVLLQTHPNMHFSPFFGLVNKVIFDFLALSMSRIDSLNLFSLISPNCIQFHH